MKIALIVAVAFVTGASWASAQTAPVAPAPTAAPASTIERIVIMRHGEKPEGGLGQLTCRGLARALALPEVIIAKFGKPQLIFAPNPSRRKADSGKLYDYIRPLATVEPLAIQLGLPVDVQIGFDQSKLLVRKLSQGRYAGSFTLVAWEHKIAAEISRDIVKTFGGDFSLVEAWKSDDFDRLDVIEITRAAGQRPQASYKRDAQGLNGIPGECPKGPLKS